LLQLAENRHCMALLLLLEQRPQALIELVLLLLQLRLVS
jgi:hypothetical protein